MRASRALLSTLALWACDVSRPVRHTVEPLCPSLPTAVTMDSSCGDRHCTVDARQSGCRWTLDIRGCERDTLEAVIGADGELSFADSDLGTCVTASTTRDQVLYTLACTNTQGTCRYELYPPAAAPAWKVEDVGLLSAVFAAPAEQDVAPLDGLTPLTGYVADAVLVDGLVWAATRAGTFGTVECEGPEEARLVRVDQDTLEVGRPIPAPACLAALSRDPSGIGRFLGATAGARPRVIRFDRDGAELGALELPELAASGGLVPTALLTDGSTRAAVLLSGATFQGPSWLVVFDARTLTTAATSPVVATQLRSATRVGDTVYAADQEGHRVVVFQLADGAISVGMPVPINPANGASEDPGVLALHPPTGRLVVAGTGLHGAVAAIDLSAPRPPHPRAIAFEAEATPWALAPWPGSDDAVAVGLTGAAPAYGAVLARYSIAENRFLLGSAPLGQGVVRRLDVDARGRLWALLGWSGKLARITLR